MYARARCAGRAAVVAVCRVHARRIALLHATEICHGPVRPQEEESVLRLCDAAWSARLSVIALRAAVASTGSPAQSTRAPRRRPAARHPVRGPAGRARDEPARHGAAADRHAPGQRQEQNTHYVRQDAAADRGARGARGARRAGASLRACVARRGAADRRPALRSVRRRAGVVASPAAARVVLVLVLVVVVVLALGARRSRRAKSPADRRRRPRGRPPLRRRPPARAP